MPDNVTLRPPEKDAGAQAQRAVPGIVQKRTQLPGGGIVGIPHARLERSHVGVDRFGGKIDGTVIVLIGVAGIAQDGVRKVLQGDGQLHPTIGVAIRPVGFRPQAHGLPADEIVQHMAPPVFEGTWTNLVQRIVENGLRCSQVDVNRRQPRARGNIVEPNLGCLDGRSGVAKIEESARRTHGRKGARGNDIDFPGSLGGSFLPDDADHLLGGHDHGLPLADLLIDFLIGLKRGSHSVSRPLGRIAPATVIREL